MMNVKQALKILRKELIIKDEPLKAYNLLKRFQDQFGIKLPEEFDKTKKMLIHYFDPKEYNFTYNDNMDKEDFEVIEPLEIATNAGLKYWRYGWVLKNLKGEKAKSYMDLACYVGSVVTTASKMGIKATGVDTTKKVINVAKRRAKDVGVKCDFYCDDITTFDKVKAEHVSAMEVLEHVVDPEGLINHMADLATKWCYISTPDGPYGNGEGNLPNWDWRGPTDRRGHLRVFTFNSLKEILERNNMEIKELFSGDDGLLHTKYRRKI